ncbi:MAG: phospholipase D family protein [Phreatobacter sp.]|nr:phospholipase D family protein [Phreatobacter sp.]
MSIELIAQPSGGFRLGDFLAKSFANPDWTDFRAAVAFVKRSGTKHIKTSLEQFSKRGAVCISAGIDSGGTSKEGLADLLAAVADRGRVCVFHNENPSTFHPKIYLFKSDTAAEVVIGSVKQPPN